MLFTPIGVGIFLAGAVFFPGEKPWESANLSGKKGITFWAKGDGKTYRVGIFAQGMTLPTVIPFVAGLEWQPIKVDFSQLRHQIDTQALQEVSFVASPGAGRFVFQIDDICFV